MAIDLKGLQPSVISRDLRGKYLLLAGAPKIGKTEFCSLAPDVLILAFEKGTNGRPGVFVQPIQTWSDMKLALRQLADPEVQARFSTIAMDTIGIAYQLCEEFICGQAGVMKIGDIPYGGGYDALSKEFESTLRKITMLGYGLIMTCHLKETYDAEGVLTSARPDLNNRCLKIVNGLVDIIGVIMQEWNEKKESQRWLITRATPTVTAGTRYRFLDPKIPFGYDHLVEALGRAIDKEQELGATVVDKIAPVATEELNYDAIRAEAESLWTKLVTPEGSSEPNVENAKRIMKKIEMIFGRKVKLSEITEDQTDLFNLVLLDMKDLAKDQGITE